MRFQDLSKAEKTLRLQSQGWEESCPTERYWKFHKKRYTCYFDWVTGNVYFRKEKR